MYRIVLRSTLAAVAALILVAGNLPAQSAPTMVQLGEPDAAFPEPFSAILGIRELSTGQVLVADRIERRSK